MKTTTKTELTRKAKLKKKEKKKKKEKRKKRKISEANRCDVLTFSIEKKMCF